MAKGSLGVDSSAAKSSHVWAVCGIQMLKDNTDTLHVMFRWDHEWNPFYTCRNYARCCFDPPLTCNTFSKRVFYLHWSQPSPPNKRSEVRVTSFGQAMSLSGQYWNLKSRRRNSDGEQNQKWNIFLQKIHELVVKIKHELVGSKTAWKIYYCLKGAHLNPSSTRRWPWIKYCKKTNENTLIFSITLKSSLPCDQRRYYTKLYRLQCIYKLGMR